MTTINSNNLIIVISSPSGAGKTSVCHRLLERDDQLGLSISDTTRSARDNEIDGKDYNFISKDEFKRRIRENAYIEFATVFGNFYGSLYSNIEEHFSNGRDILFDIDWQGATQLKKSSYSNIISIFIIPPSKDTIFERLTSRSKRSGDNKESIENRMKEYETEMSHKDEYDYVVINNKLDACVTEIEKIIKNNRNR